MNMFAAAAAAALILRRSHEQHVTLNSMVCWAVDRSVGTLALGKSRSFLRLCQKMS